MQGPPGDEDRAQDEAARCRRSPAAGHPNTVDLAEGVGFEPTSGSLLKRFSRPFVPSRLERVRARSCHFPWSEAIGMQPRPRSYLVVPNGLWPNRGQTLPQQTAPCGSLLRLPPHRRVRQTVCAVVRCHRAFRGGRGGFHGQALRATPQYSETWVVSLPSSRGARPVTRPRRRPGSRPYSPTSCGYSAPTTPTPVNSARKLALAQSW
jgi:hypothetical protein